LIEDDGQKQVYRWATKFTRASSKNGDLYTTWDIRAALRADITGSMTLTEAMEEYGIPKLRHHKYMKMLLKSLGAPSAKKLRMMYTNVSLKKPKLKAALATIHKATMGRPTLLTMNEEALLVAQGEMKAVASQPVGWKQLGVQLSLMVEAFYPNRKKSSIATSAKSKLAQARQVIRRVNELEPNAEGQVKFSRTGK
jgi:hypothetical protein